MPKYRKKPIVIEAMQLTKESFNDCLNFINPKSNEHNFDECFIAIETLEGKMDAREGDYIIKGIKDEFYPCKADIFEASYQLVEET